MYEKYIILVLFAAILYFLNKNYFIIGLFGAILYFINKSYRPYFFIALGCVTTYFINKYFKEYLFSLLIFYVITFIFYVYSYKNYYFAKKKIEQLNKTDILESNKDINFTTELTEKDKIDFVEIVNNFTNM